MAETAAAGESPKQRADRGFDADAFRKDGFCGPVHLLDRCECEAILWYLTRRGRPAADHWFKGKAISDPHVRKVATRECILGPVREVLGEDIVLWGVDQVVREPGQVHPWHTDIESSSPDGGFVSVWIGLDNTDRRSGLTLISGTHRHGKPIQQVAHEHGVRREDVGAEQVADWARAIDPSSEAVRPDVADGDAIFFDGRLWHGSTNDRMTGTRRAILLQYARADRRIREPDFDQLDWPFRFHDDRQVPVLSVGGTPRRDINLVVDPPAEPGLGPTVAPVCVPLAEDPEGWWRPYDLFRGETPVLRQLGCHVSVLSPGQTPHPPHSHGDEELLIVLEGVADLAIADSPSPEGAHVVRLEAGSFAYYPAWQHHTLHNSTDRPITYLMFRWSAADFSAGRPLDWTITRPDRVGEGDPITYTTLLEGKTDYLGRLHAHATVLQPGAGYEPHCDPYDVAIVLLDGRVETLGETVGPCAAIFYPSGAPHGMRNVGDLPARYLVFEFHKRVAGRRRGNFLTHALRRVFGGR